VVLAVASAGDAGHGSVQAYNPARGTVVELTRQAFESGRLTTFGSWTYPWFVVLPKV
jgi:hypothetical protein